MRTEERAARVVALLKEAGWRLATAESCTGGLLSAAITSIGGSSAVFDLGIVTYANAAKQKFLGVRKTTLSAFGAVSRETAREMALGVRLAADADISAAITGIAGPASDGTGKPVGLVYLATALRDGTVFVSELNNRFTGDVRRQNREAAVDAALEMLEERLRDALEKSRAARDARP